MVKVKVLKHDAKTGKTEVIDEEMELPPTPKEPEGVDLREVGNLIKYARKKGWI